ncbi:MAG: F0F1 ATP synthase subunit A [Verrucomicrobiales bacterium]
MEFVPSIAAAPLLSFFDSASFLAAVDMSALRFTDEVPWFSNSTFVGLVVALLFIIFGLRAGSKPQAIPERGSSNLFEAIVEKLYDMLEGIVGHHMVGKVLPLLATIFLFVVLSNWSGLFPGVGTIGAGYEPPGDFRQVDYVSKPILRPMTSDLNGTLAVAAMFMFLWLWWTIRELGFMGFLSHLFAPKGNLSPLLTVVLAPIFLFVGFIEIISISFRPLSLSLRLYGNIYAGESLLHTMAQLGSALPPVFSFALSVLAPLPFYFLEVLIGLLQGLVFMLLCAVYIRLSTSHDDH